MINFKDVKIEKDLTYFFVSNTMISDIKWCFEKAGITDYEMIPVDKLKQNKPKHVLIPEFVPLVPTLDNSLKRPCRHPFVIISHMNTNDLLQKTVQINLKNDLDLEEKFKKEQELFNKNYDKETAHYVEIGIPVKE